MDIDSARRRDFLTAAGAAFTTSLFTGNVKGANDRVSAAFIGVGRMGQSNLNYAMKQTGIEVAAICDVYQPNLERAVAAARKGGHQPREVKDFREILADKSIDIVNISTPDHWHAYMTVEACKAGKDVYCEKPACYNIHEGQEMIKVSRETKRMVQIGSQHRSEPFKIKADRKSVV